MKIKNVWGIKKQQQLTSTQNLSAYTDVSSRKLETTKRHSYQSSTNSPYPSTQPLPKVQLYIVAECRSIYKAKNMTEETPKKKKKKRQKKHTHTHTHTYTHTHARAHTHRVIMVTSTSLNTHISASAHHSTHNRNDRHAYIDKEMGFRRRSERLNGVLLLDVLGEDIPGGGNHIPEGWSLHSLTYRHRVKYCFCG